MKDPEQNEWDDDEYNYYPQYNFNSNEFKFDWKSWEKWLKDALDDIVEQDGSWIVNGKNKKFPVSDSFSKDTAKSQYFLYLGSNHYEEAMWKKEYFACDKINIMWKAHISSNAAHYLRQPAYYKGLFDILN